MSPLVRPTSGNTSREALLIRTVRPPTGTSPYVAGHPCTVAQVVSARTTKGTFTMTPEQAQYFAARFGTIVENVERFIQGKAAVIQLALTALLAEGHLLLEDVPGLGKTSLARSLSASLGLSGARIQFTLTCSPRTSRA